MREFMLKAYTKGLTGGDWAFLDVELFKVISVIPLFRSSGVSPAYNHNLTSTNCMNYRFRAPRY